MHVCKRIGYCLTLFILYLYRQVFLITIFTSFVLHYYYIGSSFTCIILLTKQLQVLMKNFRLNFLWSSIATPCCLQYCIICVALKWFSVIQETNYPSVNIPKLCVLHTIFKLDFETLISMSTSLSKNLLSISECSLFEFTTCVVYMYVFEYCINDFICGIALCAWKS